MKTVNKSDIKRPAVGNNSNCWHGKRSRSWARSVSVAAAVATILAGSQAHALGLGEIRVKSNLGEPLDAEITLLSPQPGEMNDLRVGLGSRADFAQADIERPQVLQQLEFEVVDQSIAPIVRITSKENFTAPYLHILITAEWSGGKHVKEYTALLDPLLYDPGQNLAPGSVIATGAGEVLDLQPGMPSESFNEPVQGSLEQSQALPGSFEPVMADPSKFRLFANGGAEYGPTTAGDTLWNVGVLFRASGSDLHLFKIMMALFIENPGAFHNNNMHLLKIGESLTLDNVNATNEIPLDSASLMLNTHYLEWQNILGGLPSTTHASTVETPLSSVETQQSPALEIQPSLVAAQPGDLTDPAAVTESPQPGLEPAAAAESSDTVAAADIANTGGVATAAFTPDLAYKGLVSRIDRISDQVSENTRQLAEIRKALAIAGLMVSENESIGATTVAPTETDAVSVGEAGTSVAVTETVETAPLQTAVDAGTQATEQITGADQPGDSITVAELLESAGEGAVITGSTAEQTLTSQAPDAAQTITAIDVPEESVFSKIGSALFRNAWWMSLLAMVGLAFGWYFRQRRRSDDLYDEIYVDATGRGDPDQMTPRVLADQPSERVAVASATDDATGYYVPGAGSTAETDAAAEGGESEEEIEIHAPPSRPFTWTLDKDFYVPGLVADETLRPDPLTEAELYLAYDQHELAEKVLRKAISEKPEDKLKEKLLEIYQERNDVSGIKEITGQLSNDDDDISSDAFGESDELTIDNSQADQTEIDILRERLRSLEQALAARDNENQALQEEIWTMEGRAQQTGAANESTSGLEADFEIELEDVDGLKIESTDRDAEAMREHIQSMEEALAYRENENRELQERVDTLENQVLEMTSKSTETEEKEKKDKPGGGIKGVA